MNHKNPYGSSEPDIFYIGEEPQRKFRWVSVSDLWWVAFVVLLVCWLLYPAVYSH